MSDAYFPDFIDSSMLATFKACPAKFFLEYIQDWKPKEPSVHLHAGGAFAKALEVTRKAFYTGERITGTVVALEPGDPSVIRGDKVRWDSRFSGPRASREEAIGLGLQALMTFYGEFETDTAKSLDRMMGAFEFYWENYSLNDDDAYPILMPGGKRAIEFSFSEPLPINNPVTGNPILYCGKMDAIQNYGGSILVTDEKTTTSLGATWSKKWDLRGQLLGYVWGCDRSGIKAQGAIIRGVSILKTKYETQQAIVMFPEWQMARWYEETLDWIEEIVRVWKTGRWRHAYDDACAGFGRCTFADVCLWQDQQAQLNTYFERRRWNPVEHKEHKL
jgi:hypothetical protein